MNNEVCEVCGKTISDPIYLASLRRYKKALCIACQIDEVKRTWTKQPVLMKEKIKELKKYL